MNDYFMSSNVLIISAFVSSVPIYFVEWGRR